MPGRFALTIYRGDTFRWQFVLWGDAQSTVPVNLSGAIAESEIRERPAGTIIVPLTCIITQPNMVTVTLDAATSARLPVVATSGSWRGAWDLQLTFPNGDVSTALAGPVTVTTNVTNSTAAALAAPPLRRVA